MPVSGRVRGSWHSPVGNSTTFGLIRQVIVEI